jgi:DNA repair photolyase
VTVFLMPILPHLTDSVDAITAALERIKAAGAVRVIYGSLHLRPGVKPWFLQWLGGFRPDLLSSYRGLYPGVSAEAPKPYRQWLAKRVRPLIRMHGLDGRDEEDSYRASVRGMRRMPAPAAPATASAPAQPMLF